MFVLQNKQKLNLKIDEFRCAQFEYKMYIKWLQNVIARSGRVLGTTFHPIPRDPGRLNFTRPKKIFKKRFSFKIWSRGENFCRTLVLDCNSAALMRNCVPKLSLIRYWEQPSLKTLISDLTDVGGHRQMPAWTIIIRKFDFQGQMKILQQYGGGFLKSQKNNKIKLIVMTH